eukprot:5422157-Pleurochrysis_carterae.AAC.1
MASALHAHVLAHGGGSAGDGTLLKKLSTLLLPALALRLDACVPSTTNNTNNNTNTNDNANNQGRLFRILCRLRLRQAHDRRAQSVLPRRVRLQLHLDRTNQHLWRARQLLDRVGPRAAGPHAQ